MAKWHNSSGTGGEVARDHIAFRAKYLKVRGGPMAQNGKEPGRPSYLSVDELYDDKQTAAILHVKPCTVRNERKRGKLGFVKIGRRIFHTPEQISAYLLRQSVEACEDAHDQSLNPAKSDTIGSAKSPDEIASLMLGAELGTTGDHGRPAVSALAQQIFKRRVSNSPIGSSKTGKPPPKRDPTRS